MLLSYNRLRKNELQGNLHNAGCSAFTCGCPRLNEGDVSAASGSEAWGWAGVEVLPKQVSRDQPGLPP